MVVAGHPNAAPELDFVTDLIKPFPRQQQFLDAADQYEYTLFGGAAGPGKSYALRWWLLSLLLRWYAALGLRGVRVGLFCEDYPSLKDRHLDKVKVEFPSWMGTLHETTHEFRLHPEYGGGVLAFRNLDRPAKYQSVEFAAIGVDELTLNPRETFDVLRARKRWPGIDFSPFGAGTNPGGIGHYWVKKLWIDRDFTGTDDEELDPSTFHFVPARADDNPALPKSYYATLNSLPPTLRKAFADGDWNIFVGQFFKEWRDGHHTCAPFPIPATWTTRRISVDFGYGAPFSCHFYARDEDLWAKERIHRWYAYREFYGPGIRDDEQAAMIAAGIRADLEAAHPRHPLQITAFGDPSMFSKKPMQNVSVAEVYAKAGVKLNPANNERVIGWQRVRAYFADQRDKRPAVIFFDTCRKAITTIPACVHDKLNVEDVDTDGEDHAADELRYFCMAAGPIDLRKPRDNRPTNVNFGDGRGPVDENDPHAVPRAVREQLEREMRESRL